MTARRALLWLHRWLGLGAGLAMLVTAATGTVLAFHVELDALLNPVLLAPGPAGPALPPAALLDAALPALRPGETPFYLNLPPSRPDLAVLSVAAGEEIYDLVLERATGRPRGRRLAARAGDPFAGPFLEVLRDLHARLWAGRAGEVALGAASAMLLVSALSGLWLWWPRNGRWRAALALKWPARPVRLNYDLHKLSGVLAWLVLVVVLFSGVAMNLPVLVRPVVALFSPAPPWPEGIRASPAPARLGVAEAVAAVDALFPDGAWQGVLLPREPGEPMQLRKRAPGEVTQAYTQRQAWLDPATGTVLLTSDPARFSAGEHFMEWQYPLHSGEAFGLVGRVLVSLAGLTGCVGAISGTALWWLRRRAARAGALR